jgi:hypothetical protein
MSQDIHSKMNTLKFDWEPSKELVSIIKSYNINGFECPGGTDKNTTHNYTGIYEHLLSGFKNKKGKLLEIGVQHGGSSLLWQTYLPKFEICMLDICDIVHPYIWECMDENGNDYSFYEANAYDESFVSALKHQYNGFDIIIDDGPHTLESQLFAIKHYLPLLNNHGVFVIEDIQDIAHTKELADAVPNFLQSVIRTYDVRHTKKRYDDVIFCVDLR